MPISGANLPVPSCANVNMLAAAYGAATVPTGAERLFASLGAPPAVHHALAGSFADYQCRSGFNMDSQFAMAAASGFGGALVARVLMSRVMGTSV